MHTFMGTDYRFKSMLLVSTGDKYPVVETFHADTEDEIFRLQQQWMQHCGYSVADMHLFSRSSGGTWQVVRQCSFQRLPELPPFLPVGAAPYEAPSVHALLQGALLQTATGRVVRISCGDAVSGDGLMPADIVFELSDGQSTLRADLLVPSPGDRELLLSGQTDRLRLLLHKELYTPLAAWVAASRVAGGGTRT